MAKKIAAWALLAITGLSAMSFAGDLDGTKWQARDKGLKGSVLFWRKDKLNFDNGMFTSGSCVPYGFRSSAYESKKVGDKVTWNSVQANDKGESMMWNGTCMGKKMSGMYTWKGPNGKMQTCSWRAKMMKE